MIIQELDKARRSVKRLKQPIVRRRLLAVIAAAEAQYHELQRIKNTPLKLSETSIPKGARLSRLEIRVEGGQFDAPMSIGMDVEAPETYGVGPAQKDLEVIREATTTR